MRQRSLLETARTARTAPDEVLADPAITALGDDPEAALVLQELAFHGPEAMRPDDPEVLDSIDSETENATSIRGLAALAPVHEPFVEALEAKLKDPSYRIREWTASGLVVAAACDSGAVKSLVPILEARLTDRSSVQFYVKNVLSYIAPENDSLRDLLTEYVRDGDEDERTMAAATIARAVRREGIQGRTTTPFDAGVTVTVDALADADEETVSSLAGALETAARGWPSLVYDHLDSLLVAAERSASADAIGEVLGIGAVREDAVFDRLTEQLASASDDTIQQALLTGIARGWLARPGRLDDTSGVERALHDHGDALDRHIADPLRALTGVGSPVGPGLVPPTIDPGAMLDILAEADNWIDLNRSEYNHRHFATLADRDPEALLPHASFLLELLEQDSFNVREPVAACAAQSETVTADLVELLLSACEERGRPVAELITLRKTAQRNPEHLLTHRQTLLDLLSHKKPSVRYRTALTLVPIVLAHPDAVAGDRDTIIDAVADPNGKVRSGTVKLGAALSARHDDVDAALEPAMGLLRDARHEDPLSHLGVDPTGELEREWAGVAAAFADNVPAPASNHDTVADLAIRALLDTGSEYDHQQALAAEAVERVAPDRGAEVVATLHEMDTLSKTVGESYL